MSTRKTLAEQISYWNAEMMSPAWSVAYALLMNAYADGLTGPTLHAFMVANALPDSRTTNMIHDTIGVGHGVLRGDFEWVYL